MEVTFVEKTGNFELRAPGSLEDRDRVPVVKNLSDSVSREQEFKVVCDANHGSSISCTVKRQKLAN
jgi:hypothetical protein